MATYIALLRGINVGGKRVIKMADLTAMVVAAGGRDVATYIQSGNVVFGHRSRSAAAVAARLADHIAQQAGFEVAVIVRTPHELAATIAGNPFPRAPTDTLHVGFLALAPTAAPLDGTRFVPERYACVGREIYIEAPHGLGKSRLLGALTKPTSIGADATVRNWRTVCALDELARGR